jgi:hypothetical protein
MSRPEELYMYVCSDMYGSSTHDDTVYTRPTDDRVVADAVGVRAHSILHAT